MDQNLDICGKKYVSAKRASEISGYNSDYLGQLCRSGKLECKLISRTWFVTENSLSDHQRTNGRKKHGLRTHILLDEPLKEKEVGFFGDNQRLLLGYARRELSRNISSVEKKALDRKLILNFSLAFFVSFLMVTVLGFNSFSVKNNSFVYQNTEKIIIDTKNFLNQSDFAQSASLEQIKIFKEGISERYLTFKNKLQITILTLFSRDKDYLVHKTNVSNQSVVPKFNPDDDKGAVMIPVSESDVSNLGRVKNYLRDSFSDEIEIVPDESGVAGVIRPVFTDPNKEEYFYVMVPIK